MPRTIIVRTSDNAITTLDPQRLNGNVVLPDDGNQYQVVQVSDVEAAKFGQAGVFTLGAQNTVVVGAPPADTPLSSAEAERVQTRADLNNAFTAAITRIDSDIAAIDGYTAAQVRDAFKAALIRERAELKFIKANLT